MKKYFGIILVFLLSFFIQVSAAEIEVQPAITSRCNEQNRVWVGTFQIVWNEFIDKFVHQPVRFREGTPASVNELNKRNFSASNISDNCYYKFSGKVTKSTKSHIENSLKRKFHETSDILSTLNLTPSPNNFLIYAMLKKDFEFLREFEKLGISPFGENMTAEYFGIGKNTSKNTKDAVTVLYYNNPRDFAIMLATKGQDELYLYKNAANKDFRTLYKDMNIKKSKYEGATVLGDEDELKVPNIKFDVTANFSELEGKRIMGTNLHIDQALETIKFNMDNKGVQLKSEAAILTESIAMPLENAPEPRYFFFDNTFVIFLKEKDSKVPYFALRVDDISLFQ